MKTNLTNKQQLFQTGVRNSFGGIICITPIVWFSSILLHRQWWFGWYFLVAILAIIITVLALLDVSNQTSKSPKLAIVCSLLFCGVLGGVQMIRGEYVRKDTTQVKQIYVKHDKKTPIASSIRITDKATKIGIIWTALTMIVIVIILTIPGMNNYPGLAENEFSFDPYVYVLVFAAGASAFATAKYFFGDKKMKKWAVIVGYTWGLILGGILINKGQINNKEEK